MASLRESLGKIAQLDGFLGASVVDSDSGLMLDSEGGGGGIDLERAAAGNTEVVRAKRKTIANLALDDGIEDILITLGKQYHLIRPMSQSKDLFVYLVLDRNSGNLALARYTLADVERALSI